MSAFAERAARSGLARAWARLPPGPRGRRALAATLVLAVVLGVGYFFWLRDSSIVGVDDVSVSGLTTEDATDIRSALVRAGRGMSSLHVDQGALERAVKGFPEVRSLEARGAFPDGLRITVVERRPAALLVSGKGRVAVAGDGTVLPGLKETDALPEVRAKSGPPAGRLGSGDQLEVVRVLAGAPEALAPKLETGALDGAKGVIVQVADGPELRFGDTTRSPAKWAAAARVLADADSAGAEYIDLTIPERPAAGGLAVETVAPVAPAGEEAGVEPTVDPPAEYPQP